MQVVLADDHMLFRESFALVLQRMLPTALITQVGDWDALKTHTEQVEADLLLIDLFKVSRTCYLLWVLMFDVSYQIFQSI